MHFVPAERASEVIPCRHIPLNEHGQTLESLSGTGTQEEVETALARWLRTKIGELEATTPEDLAGKVPASTT
jgi:hypothetical protein